MAKPPQHHVQPNGNGDWEIKRTGSERATRVVETKKEAETIAREISKRQNTELVIHRKDGTIERKDSHGNDPNPPKDKK